MYVCMYLYIILIYYTYIMGLIFLVARYTMFRFSVIITRENKFF